MAFLNRACSASVSPSKVPLPSSSKPISCCKCFIACCNGSSNSFIFSAFLTAFLSTSLATSPKAFAASSPLSNASTSASAKLSPSSLNVVCVMSCVISSMISSICRPISLYCSRHSSILPWSVFFLLSSSAIIPSISDCWARKFFITALWFWYLLSPNALSTACSNSL